MRRPTELLDAKGQTNIVPHRERIFQVLRQLAGKSSNRAQNLVLRNRLLFQFGNHGIQVLQGLSDGQRIHFAAAALAGLQRSFQVMTGNFDGQGIGNSPAGALLVFHPGRHRQSDPDRLAVYKELDVRSIGMPRGDGYDQLLLNAVDLLFSPTIDGEEIVVHEQENDIEAVAAGANHCFGLDAQQVAARLWAKILVVVKTSTSASRSKGPEIVTIRPWKNLRWLVHGFSTRTGGFSKIYGKQSLNLGFTKDDSRVAVERNRAVFLHALGLQVGEQAWPLVTLRQVHSDLIHHLEQAPKTPLVGDGLITRTPGILLAVQTADCIPVVLVDANIRAVGVFHAGWRGTVKRIVEKGAGEMRRWYGSQPRDLSAAIGPGIRACCYQVGEEVRNAFHGQFAYADKLFRESKESDEIRLKYPLLFLTARAPGHSELPTKIFLDLVEANRQQLLAAGVRADNISVSELCTRCRTDMLFSHRAEHGKTGRMMAVAGIRP